MANDAHEALALVEEMQNMLLSHATGGNYDAARYVALRKLLLDHTRTRDKLPRWIRTCRSSSEFWAYIKAQFAHYDERRRFIWDAFRPLIEELEQSPDAPADQEVSDVLESFDVESVHDVWQRALDRRVDDPEGAITMARTLLETVCKYILDEEGVTYDPAADLPHLYKLVAKELNLDPVDHADIAIKRILGGAHSVVEGLGALRNAMGDAHGRGKRGRKAEARHAALAVNLAGATATFLVETWQKNRDKGQGAAQ